MRISSKVIATVVAAAVVTGSMSAPASAFVGPWFFKPWLFKPWFFKPHFKYPPYHPKPKSTPTSSSGSSMQTGQFVVGCIMGSALGLIWAAAAKAAANGQPLRWLSQTEYEATRNDTTNHLTSQQSALIAFSCGLGAFPVVASFDQQP